MSNSHLAAPRPFIPALSSVYDRLAPLAYPMVRVTVGLFLMPHGAQKLFGWFGGHGLDATATSFATKMGLEPGLLWATLAGLTEFFGGLAVAIGFLTRPAAAAVFVLLMVAAIKVHLPNGFFWSQGGFEYPVLWGLMALAIVFRGGGEMSVDSRIGREF